VSKIIHIAPINLDDDQLLAVSSGATAIGGNGGSAGGTSLGNAFSDSNFGGINGDGGNLPPPTPAANFTVVDMTTNASTTTAGDAYTGPVVGLQHQYTNLTADSL